jgi:hypothetical protein
MHMTYQPQEITISSASNDHYWVAYYSSLNGQWLDGKAELNQATENIASLRNENVLKPAKYQIKIGNQQHVECVANIEQPAFAKHPKFINHSGNCHTQEVANGKLVLMVDKQTHQPPHAMI